MTAREILDENRRSESYWFKHRMEDFESLMKLKGCRIEKECMAGRKKESFDCAEVEHLLMLAV